MSEELPPFVRVDLPREQQDELWAEADKETVGKRLQIVFHGDESSWPCPRCSLEAPARRAKFVRRVRLGASEEAFEDAEIRDATESDVDRIREGVSFASDISGGIFDRLLGRVSKSVMNARVYACDEHGEFYVPFWNGEPKAFQLQTLDAGYRLRPLPTRYLFCTGVIETIANDGTRRSVSVCDQILERKSASDDGPSSYTCPMHGTLTTTTTLYESGFPYPVVRRIAD